MKISSPFSRLARTFATLSILLSLAGVSLDLARGETVVKEDFSQTGGDRVAGETIKGVTLPNSQLHWICKGNSVQFGGTKEDPYGTFVVQGQAVAALELPTEGDTIEIEANVHPSPMTKGWIAIGVGKPVKEFDNCWPDGFFLLLNNDGAYEAYLKGTSISIAAGTIIAGFNETGMNTIKLIYDKRDNQLTCYINDRVVMKTLNLNSKDFVPDLTYAGFSAFGQAVNCRSIKDFTITLK